MHPIINQIRENLRANANSQVRDDAQHFFKEAITCYGVKTATVTKISHKYWTEIKQLSKKDVFIICEDLFSSGFMEEAFVVADWLPKFVGQFQREDLAVFERWIGCYIDNWAKCDSFCNHTVGDFMIKFPECVNILFDWAKYSNRWFRRAAAVSLIVPAKRGLFLQEAFKISNLLLTDSDDLVQKGYGWLLKAETEKHPDEVLMYVMENKLIMPRTALRYAIEKLPKEQKMLAMKKE
jgi:3-methyladenine DNA glycosylase AlkD